MKTNTMRSQTTLVLCAVAALAYASRASAQNDFVGTWSLVSNKAAVGNYTFCVISSSVVVDGTGEFSANGTIANAVGTVGTNGAFSLTIRETNTSSGLATTRVFTGTLNTMGAGNGTATLSDASGPLETANWTATRSSVTSQCTGAGAVPLSLATSSLPRAIIGSTYTTSLVGQGGIPPYTFAVTGLPASLTFDAGTATFGGVADAGTAGSYILTITITDDIGTSEQGQLTLVVAVAETSTGGPTFGCCGTTTAISLAGITLALFLMRFGPRRRRG